MKKRVICILLCLCMVLMLFPTSAMADDATDLYNLVNSKDGVVKLNKDYTLDKRVLIKKSITLDLNGHVIKSTGSKSILAVDSYRTVTLTDSNSKATHSGDNASLPAGGVITGANSEGGGGIEVMYSGTLIMNGGTIYGCYGVTGGGVMVAESNGYRGAFIMNGGTIKNCSGSDGGAVFVDGDFTMNGGTIEGCSALYGGDGGGVFVMDSGNFEMKNGTIKNCTSVETGGGVVAFGGFTMSGGTIEGCSAVEGGGVYILSTFTMNDGLIQNCEADDEHFGDAIRVNNSSVLNANGGTVKGKCSVGQFAEIKNTNPNGYTVFYDEITNNGTISSGVCYGNIKKDEFGVVKDTYHTVTFDLNGAEGSIPTQWFVNVSKAKALKPADPKRSGYVFGGWYDGTTKYDFTQPVTKNVKLNAKWISGNVSDADELTAAVKAGFTSIKLLNDITLDSMLKMTDKKYTLDLNGHTLKGSISLEDTSVDRQSELTLVDSSYEKDGVLEGDIYMTGDSSTQTSILYANGGTVKGSVSMPGPSAKIFCTSGTPTAFMGNVGNSGEIHGGIFYAGIQSDNIKEHNIIFNNNGIRYATEVTVRDGKVVEPIAPTMPEGKLFTGWYTDEEFTDKYEFGRTPSGTVDLFAGSTPVTYTVTYDTGKGEGSIAAGTKTYGVEYTLSSDTFTRDGFVQTGWKDKEGTVYDLGGAYTANADVTLYPVWDKIITINVPFTTTVEQGDNVPPGKMTFDLELIDSRLEDDMFADVTAGGSVETDGAGEYKGELTFTGPFGKLWALLCDVVFVKQADVGEEDWIYDNAGWGIKMWEVSGNLSEDLEDLSFKISIYPTTVDDTGDGLSYVLDWNNDPVEEMRFKNIYTAHEHEYELKHDENVHWDECGCGDIQNEEPHKYGKWTVTKEATTTEEGEREHTCTVCGYTEAEVIAKLAETDEPDEPTDAQTGDNGNIMLWLALLAVSAAGVIGLIVYGRRRRGSREK